MEEVFHPGGEEKTTPRNMRQVFSSPDVWLNCQNPDLEPCDVSTLDNLWVGAMVDQGGGVVEGFRPAICTQFSRQR